MERAVLAGCRSNIVSAILSAVLGLAIFVLPQHAHAAMDNYPIARLRMLDKVTARTSTFDVRVDTTVRFGQLYIRPRACRKATPLEAPESASFLQVWEVTPKQEARWIFSGWMFASSPALSSMDHPIYDVWVLDCVGDMPMDAGNSDAAASGKINFSSAGQNNPAPPANGQVGFSSAGHVQVEFLSSSQTQAPPQAPPPQAPVPGAGVVTAPVPPPGSEPPAPQPGTADSAGTGTPPGAVMPEGAAPALTVPADEDQGTTDDGETTDSGTAGTSPTDDGTSASDGDDQPDTAAPVEPYSRLDGNPDGKGGVQRPRAPAPGPDEAAPSTQDPVY